MNYQSTRSQSRIRFFLFLRKATDSAECCLFRFCKISAVFYFWRTVLNTWPRRFDRIFRKRQPRVRYSGVRMPQGGFAHPPNCPSPEPHGAQDWQVRAGGRNGRRETEERRSALSRRCRVPRSPCVDNRLEASGRRSGDGTSARDSGHCPAVRRADAAHRAAPERNR
jgi:hypothetical protein